MHSNAAYLALFLAGTQVGVSALPYQNNVPAEDVTAKSSMLTPSAAASSATPSSAGGYAPSSVVSAGTAGQSAVATSAGSSYAAGIFPPSSVLSGTGGEVAAATSNVEQPTYAGALSLTSNGESFALPTPTTTASPGGAAPEIMDLCEPFAAMNIPFTCDEIPEAVTAMPPAPSTGNYKRSPYNTVRSGQAAATGACGSSSTPAKEPLCFKILKPTIVNGIPVAGQ